MCASLETRSEKQIPCLEKETFSVRGKGFKTITLSSEEAELIAVTQTVSEAFLIKKAWEFLVQTVCGFVARSDSSVVRAISQALGVGRVRHLQNSALWIQRFFVFYRSPRQSTLRMLEQRYWLRDG